MSNIEPNIELLTKEYFHLQTEIESFDEKSLTIKAWSVTLSGAIAGSSAFTQETIVLIFAAVVSLMFWFIDGSWKTFQYANYRRIGAIEKYMSGKKSEIANLQISSSWQESHKSGGKKRLFRIMGWSHVFLPHGAMFFLLTAAYLSNVYF